VKQQWDFLQPVHEGKGLDLNVKKIDVRKKTRPQGVRTEKEKRGINKGGDVFFFSLGGGYSQNVEKGKKAFQNLTPRVETGAEMYLGFIQSGEAEKPEDWGPSN